MVGVPVPGLKCNGYTWESWLVRHLRKAVYAGALYRYVKVLGSVHWEGVYSVGECTLQVLILLIDY